VPTLTFDLLFVFLILGHGRRWLLWFEVTRHPTAEFSGPAARSSRFFTKEWRLSEIELVT
jgi:hypothetical protein